MKLAETLVFDIVTMALTRARRNLYVVILFVGFMALSAMFKVMLHSSLAGLIAFIPFIFIVMFVSNIALKLKRIGSISLLNDSIHLHNEVLPLERIIAVNEIKTLLIKGGAQADLRGRIITKRKTLFLDFTLKNDELITVHIAVPEDDEITCDQITVYCRAQGISCSRKI